MTLLEWSWTLRFGPYARATFAAQPFLRWLPFVAGAGASLVLDRDASFFADLVLVLLVAAAVVLLLLAAVARGLRRLRAATGSTVQRYTLTADVLQIALGQDRLSVPLSELSVVRTGRVWIVLSRPALGHRRTILFFDDTTLLPQVRALVEQHGARTRT